MAFSPGDCLCNWGRGESCAACALPAPPLGFDPERVADAKDRARTLLRDAAYHDSQAKSARATAGVLAKTWGFSLDKLSGGA